jgi:ferric-dicitrate binding protein FerR (iron transport regulator)
MELKSDKIDQEKYRMIWTKARSVGIFGRFNPERAWHKVDSKIASDRIRVRRLKNLAYAASGMAASLLIFFSLAFFSNLFTISESEISMSTAYGSRSEVVLPDGSVVKLNAGSSLDYHFDKLTKTRKVEFKGEGFFEVAKSKQPFVIQTPEGLNVKVLGTQFNLSAYPEDQSVKTSLVEGSVELSINGENEIRLKPGQIALFDKQSGKLEYVSGDVLHQTGWTQDKLYMDNMSLNEVCRHLERWYDVTITLTDQKIGESIHYTGVLKEQTIQDVFNALSQLSSISYALKGKEIRISGR